jgi:histone H3/H4
LGGGLGYGRPPPPPPPPTTTPMMVPVPPAPLAGMGGPPRPPPAKRARRNAALLDEQLKQRMQTFWEGHFAAITQGPLDLGQHQVPLARIRRIMKEEDELSAGIMISATAPAMLAKACELFVEEMTTRSWVHTEHGRRKTLKKDDLIDCVSRVDMYDCRWWAAWVHLITSPPPL